MKRKALLRNTKIKSHIPPSKPKGETHTVFCFDQNRIFQIFELFHFYSFVTQASISSFDSVQIGVSYQSWKQRSVKIECHKCCDMIWANIPEKTNCSPSTATTEKVSAGIWPGIARSACEHSNLLSYWALMNCLSSVLKKNLRKKNFSWEESLKYEDGGNKSEFADRDIICLRVSFLMSTRH